VRRGIASSFDTTRIAVMVRCTVWHVRTIHTPNTANCKACGNVDWKSTRIPGLSGLDLTVAAATLSCLVPNLAGTYKARSTLAYTHRRKVE